LADLLIPYVALAYGSSSYLTRTLSEHLETNIWLAEKILKTKFTITRANGLYRVERVGDKAEEGKADSIPTAAAGA
jgi:RNA 3'-terminal phosphate cyclase